MTKLQLKGIYFENLEENFDKLIIDGKKNLEISSEKYAEIIGNGIAEILDIYNKGTIDLYVNHNKFTIEKFLEIT